MSKRRKPDIGIFQKETSNGHLETSLSRVISGVLVLSGIGLAGVAVVGGMVTPPMVSLILGVIGIGVTGKVVSGGLDR